MLKKLFHKRKYFAATALIALCLALSAVMVYGVVLFRSYVVGKGDMDTGTLSGGVTVGAVANENLIFTYPGMKIDIPMRLSNTTSGALHYYYELSRGAETRPNGFSLSSAIFVYYDGEFLGTLSEICDAGGKIDVNNYVPEPVGASATDEHTFTFELHIDAPESVYGNANVNVQITGYAETIDYQKYMFVKNEDEFRKAVDDINSGLLAENVAIILSQPVTLTEAYEIKRPCVIDLYGNELNLNAQTLTLSANGTIKLISTKTTDYTTLSASGSIVLNAPGLLFDIEDFYSSQTVDGEKVNTGALYGALTSVTSCDTEAAVALVMSRLDNNIGVGINSGKTLSLFGALSFYKNSITVDASGAAHYAYNAQTGVLTAGGVDATSVDAITVGDINKEFKIIGPGSDALVEAMLTSGELRHIPNISEGVIPSVTSDIFLPKSLKSKGVTVTWVSSDPETISDDGKISDTVKDNTEINMYAEIRINDKLYTRVFTFKVSSQNNDTKFSYIVAQLSPITLENVYTAGNEANSHLYLPVVMPLEGTALSDYDYRAEYESPSASPTLTWEGYRDVKLEWIHYSVSNTYNYISLTNTWNDVRTGEDTWEVDQTRQNCAVYLNTAVFFTYAQIDVIGKFENDDKIYEGKVNVIIKLGDNTELQEIVFEHISRELQSIDVLQNILDTRKADGMNAEKGDFHLDSEYMTYDITYSIPESSAGIISSVTEESVLDEDTGLNVDKYRIGINGEGFYSAATDIGINVTLTLKEAYQTGTGATAASRTKVLYFNVPGALHPDDNGFSNFSVFNSVKFQVFQQLPADEKAHATGFDIVGRTLTNTTGKYILIHDIERTDCKELYFSMANGTDTQTDNEQAHELMRLLSWATGDKRAAASSVLSSSTTSVDYSLEYNDAGTYSRLPAGASVTALAPADQTVSGNYMYYNAADAKWQYYSFAAGTSTTYTLTFNCLQMKTTRTETNFNNRVIYDDVDGNGLNTSTTIRDESNFVFLTEADVATMNAFLNGNPTEDITLGQTNLTTLQTTDHYIYCPSTGRYAGSTAGTSDAQITMSTERSVMFRVYYYNATYPYAIYSTDNTTLPTTTTCRGFNIHGSTQQVCRYMIHTSATALDQGSFWTISAGSNITDTATGVTGSVYNVYDVYGTNGNTGVRSVFTEHTAGNKIVDVNIAASSATVQEVTGISADMLFNMSDGKDYLTDSEVAVIKAYYQNVTGCTDGEWDALWATIAERATGYVITDGAVLNATIKTLIATYTSKWCTHIGTTNDDYAYFKYVEVIQWATNEKDFGTNMGIYGSSPNLGTIESRNYTDVNGVLHNTESYKNHVEDDTEYITETERSNLVAYWYNAPASSTDGAECGRLFEIAFNENTTIPTYLNYNGANLLVRALYTALDAAGTIDLSAFVSEISPVPGGAADRYYPHITGADDSFIGLSYFINLEKFCIYEDESTDAPAFLTTIALANFFNRLTANNAEKLTMLVMQNCAQGYVEFDLSQALLLTKVTYLDLKNNPGINNVGALLGLDIGTLTYLDVSCVTVEDEYKIYVLQNIYSAGVATEIHYTSDGGKVCTAADLGSTDALTALTYLKEINRVNSIYLQLAKKLVIDSSSNALDILWRVEKGNMMHGAPVTAAGNQKYTEVNSVAGMQALVRNYYYCTGDFTYNGQNFAAGNIYHIGYNGTSMTVIPLCVAQTANIIPTTLIESEITANEVALADTEDREYLQSGPTAVTSVEVQGTANPAPFNTTSGSSRIYIYHANTTTYLRVYNLYYTMSTITSTTTYRFYRNINRTEIVNMEKYYYYTGGDITQLGTNINHNNTISCTYNFEESTAVYCEYTKTEVQTVVKFYYRITKSGDYLCLNDTDTWSTSGTTYLRYGTTYWSYTTTSGTTYYYGNTSSPTVNDGGYTVKFTYNGTDYTTAAEAQAAIETAGDGVFTEDATKSVYSNSLTSCGNYLSNVNVIASSADTQTAFDYIDSVNNSVADGFGYYRYTGANGTVNNYYASPTAESTTYTAGSYYRLSYDTTTQRSVLNTANIVTDLVDDPTDIEDDNMESILDEANTHLSDALYGNYYGNYYYYTGTTSTVNGHTYVNGNVYRLLESGGAFYYTNDFGVQNDPVVTTVSSASAMNDVLTTATAADVDKLYYYDAEIATAGGITYIKGNLYRLAVDRYGYYYFTTEIGLRNTAQTVTTIASLQTIALDATVADIGKIYWYTGDSARTYATNTFYEMSRNDTTGTYYLKHLGALGTELNMPDATAPSRLSNERYYGGGEQYGGTGGTEQAIITAIVTSGGNTYMRKFAVSVIG